jgi:hypothetical protein
VKPQRDAGSALSGPMPFRVGRKRAGDPETSRRASLTAMATMVLARNPDPGIESSRADCGGRLQLQCLLFCLPSRGRWEAARRTKTGGKDARGRAPCATLRRVSSARGP